MNSLSLTGIDGRHLWGFLTALGVLSMLDEHARESSQNPPRLAFREDGMAELQCSIGRESISKVLVANLKSLQPYLERNLGSVDSPADFTRESYENAALTGSSPTALDLLAGLACVIEEKSFESTLCAANGASHQCMIRSMRDILKLVEEQHIEKALFSTWTYSFRLAKTGEDKEVRKRLNLGNRNPTLRLDPSDERLYALRLSNPTTTDDFSTELGAQALAIPAFALLPVVPGKRPVTVSSRRLRQRVTFSWMLWGVPATLFAVRSLIWMSAGQPNERRERGVFAAFSADRISGEKGKLSFAPSQGVW